MFVWPSAGKDSVDRWDAVSRGLNLDEEVGLHKTRCRLKQQYSVVLIVECDRSLTNII